MSEKFERYNLEQAQEEAAKMKEPVGEKVAKEDYDLAEKLLDKEKSNEVTQPVASPETKMPLGNLEKVIIKEEDGVGVRVKQREKKRFIIRPKKLEIEKSENNEFSTNKLFEVINNEGTIEISPAAFAHKFQEEVGLITFKNRPAFWLLIQSLGNNEVVIETTRDVGAGYSGVLYHGAYAPPFSTETEKTSQKSHFRGYGKSEKGRFYSKGHVLYLENVGDKITLKFHWPKNKNTGL